MISHSANTLEGYKQKIIPTQLSRGFEEPYKYMGVGST